MSRFFIILIKGIVVIIWFLATVITSILLSPFVLASWISGKLDKKQSEDKEKPSSEDSNNLP
ncbi:hypothetical protein ACFP1I_20105 [Dyadobacter subterraneus]|uniref:Uncharacterized protein n=1 Tax=Dyadobacter subterraneus TaxID=2773304 RepID=A0ABR9W5V7_9BACT|nr:hypothetical protein [Dyadobacter subterraneus]MBE9460843.1 hypothetical protein [Dyadobacter subterraneus]